MRIYWCYTVVSDLRDGCVNACIPKLQRRQTQNTHRELERVESGVDPLHLPARARRLPVTSKHALALASFGV